LTVLTTSLYHTVGGQKQGQVKVSKENLLEWIENYRWMVETIEEARQPVA
jgi:hypothetical protein